MTARRRSWRRQPVPGRFAATAPLEQLRPHLSRLVAPAWQTSVEAEVNDHRTAPTSTGRHAVVSSLISRGLANPVISSLCTTWGKNIKKLLIQERFKDGRDHQRTLSIRQFLVSSFHFPLFRGTSCSSLFIPQARCSFVSSPSHTQYLIQPTC